MVWKMATDLGQLQQKERETIVVDGHKILFIWHKEQVHAVQAQCPHFKLPLAKGKISDDDTLTCPFHKSEFDLATGEVKCWTPWPPAVGKVLGKIVKEHRLKIYPTRIVSDKIEVELI